MTRDELIEAMARAICCPEGCTGDTGSGNPCNIRSEDSTSILQAQATLTTIEAQGLVIVEHRLVRAVAYVAAENLPRPTDGTATSMLLYEQKVDEINALLKQAIPI